MTFTPGAHIIWIDHNNVADLVLDSNTSQIKVVNHGTEQLGGTVTILW